MGTLLEFAEALKARAAALQVAPNEIALLIRQGTNTLSRLAFAACSPGQQATDEQVRALFPEGHVSIPGAVSSLKHLIFEAQTMVIADVKQRVARKDEVQPTALAAAERLNRIEDQRARLTGLRLRGEEEVAHSCYDMVLTMIERDALVYLSPDKFYTRRTELLQQKPKKELALDSATLTIRDKNPSLSCSTATELEAVNAFRRRSLAFDLVNLVNYDTMNTYHSELVDHMSLSPPPKWDKNGNKVGNKNPEAGQEWEQSGNKLGTKPKQSRNKNPKVGQEWKQSGNGGEEPQSGTRIGTKWEQSGSKNPKAAPEWQQSRNKNRKVGQELE